MSNTPEEASADMRQLARVYRDMYVALVAEGFSPPEALTIIGHTIGAMLKSGGSS